MIKLIWFALKELFLFNKKKKEAKKLGVLNEEWYSSNEDI